MHLTMELAELITATVIMGAIGHLLERKFIRIKFSHRRRSKPSQELLGVPYVML